MLTRAVDLLLVSRYLHRPHFPAFARLLAPGGLLLFHTFLVGAESVGRCTPTRPRFLVRPPSPSCCPSLAHQLSPGELRAAFEASFDIVTDEVLLLPDGRPTSCFLARRK